LCKGKAEETWTDFVNFYPRGDKLWFLLNSAPNFNPSMEPAVLLIFKVGLILSK
jgi:hypothetical protein